MSATGLVPSINKSEMTFQPPFGGAETVEVDRVRARCTRFRKNLGVGAKLLSNAGPRQPWMLTLTYADATAWTPKHVAVALDLMRKWAHRQGFKLRYLWVMETVARKSGDQVGMVAPHYHLVVWLPHGVSCPPMDAMGWWPHGLTNTVKAKAPVRYVMKYASKFDNAGDFPKGARIYGMGGLTDSDRRIRRWINWPRFVQGNASVSCTWRRATGGGWLDASTGELWPSEWGLVSLNSTCTRLVRLRTHARAIQADGPFSWVKPWTV